MGMKYFEIFLFSFFLLKSQENSEDQRILFFRLSRSRIWDFILRQVHSENVKSKTKLTAGLKNVKPHRHFCLWPIGDFPTRSVF